MPAMRSALLGLLALSCLAAGCDDAPPPTVPPQVEETAPAAARPRFVGLQSCRPCHEHETELFTGSHHDRAMDEATEETVLGDFDDATHEWYGVTSTFYREDGKFMVRTEGPDGKLADYEVLYVFGFDPLQQYLVEFPGGRYQTLPLCWDVRPEAEGGQRWFHIYADEHIAPGDVLHWTGPNQSWNYMCAECHSTRLRKGYDGEKNRYDTTWSEIDVSCEACHGPGSAHLEWVAKSEGLKEGEGERAGSTGLVRLTGRAQIETCGRCHSRHTQFEEEYVHGAPLLDTHRVQILSELQYHADGQILDEVYVYGSFLQSRMFHEGVVCADCHDPHSMRTYSADNGLCARCHDPKEFDVKKHHFHEPGTVGASCVECHMPESTYMVVDPRRDHSIRIPRPDLSLTLGTPDACSRCHDDEPVEWSAEHVEKWYGEDRRKEWHYGEAIHAGRTGSPGAVEALVRLATKNEYPAIARATAVSLLPRYPTEAAGEAIAKAAHDPEPIVRVQAARSLDLFNPARRAKVAAPLLTDPVRLVRVEAARALSDIPRKELTDEQWEELKVGMRELFASERTNADRGFSHSNLGLLLLRIGWRDRAKAAFRKAIEIEPGFVQARVNLADVLRLEGDERGVEKILRGALVIAPSDPGLHHALGLTLVRTRRLDKALIALRRAAELAPQTPRFSYVYAIALHSTGKPDEAIARLEETWRRHPADREILQALATILRDRGSLGRARFFARKLLELDPGNPAYRRLLQSLDRGR